MESASAAGRLGASDEQSLFARKATGLVRGWAVRDAFIYAFFSINLITLGLFIFSYAVFVPMFAIIGWDDGVTFFSEDKGLFWASIITALLASGFIALGIRTYARIQKFCFYGGLVGLAFMFVLLLVNSKTDFISALNTQSQEVLGTGPNVYQGTLDAGAAGTPGSVGDIPAISGLFLLVPFIVFFNLWSNWGATLYGEVRGASDFRKNIRAMGGALIATTILAAISLLLFAKTFGWDFYNAANNGYWGQPALFDYVENPPLTFFPYPGLLAAFLMDGAVWQFILVGLLALWFFGWGGTVFLSSTRVVFATAFDRVLPEGAAKVSRSGVPYVALALMLIPALPISWFYAFNEEFYSWTLAATMVIAITFAGSAIAAAVLPWRKPEIYNASPIARYRIAGTPLITVTAIGFLALLVFCLYKWIQDDVYGLNDSGSLIYMGVLYVVALAIYVGSRLLRKRQGIDMTMVHKEIPAE